MATRGRKPKPAYLRALEGSFRRDRHNDSPPTPRPVRPSRPAFLSKLAKKMWDQICDVMEDMQILTMADRNVIICYCEVWAMLEDELRKKPREISPRELDLLTKRLQSLGAELGLSPTARQRIHVKPKEKSGEIPGILD